MELRVEEHGPHIAVVTIDNRPRRNAMPRAMMAELAEVWDRLEPVPERRELRHHRARHRVPARLVVDRDDDDVRVVFLDAQLHVSPEVPASRQSCRAPCDR